MFYILYFLQVVTGCETKNKYRVCNSMSQQVYFAQEGMLVQFLNVGYFTIYFYYQEFVAKNLGMWVTFKGYLYFNLSITSMLLSNMQFLKPFFKLMLLISSVKSLISREDSIRRFALSRKSPVKRSKNYR